jgi:flagellar basal body rod protein FlgC
MNLAKSKLDAETIRLKLEAGNAARAHSKTILNRETPFCRPVVNRRFTH